MCGIFGFVGNHKLIDRARVHELMSHRGPDDSGIYEHDKLLYMHWRLSIQDLSPLGHQPMISKDGDIVLIFNGEIYNHWEIRKELESKYQFISCSDTETILYGYIEYGEEIFNKLNGIFAISIFDKKRNELILVRDQFGVKPLYYYCDADQFVFSSESKSIVELQKKNLSINSEGLVNYLNFLWSPGEDTAYKEINKLPAGHLIRLDLNHHFNFQLLKYYEIPFAEKKEIKDYQFWQDELEERLLDAVERQLLSDVPVGFFLSGGLDSSLLVALYRKLNPKAKIKAFTISTGREFEQEGFSSDLSYAQKVASHLHVDLSVIESKMNMVHDFSRMIYQLDEPQADLAPLHVENICRQARKEGYIVLLSGSGGDDLFSGYRRHQMITQYNRISKIPFHSSFLKLAKNISDSATKRRIDKYMQADKAPDLIEALANTYSWLDLPRIQKLFNSRHQGTIQSYNPVHILLESLKNIPKEKEILNQCLYWDIKYFLTDHNLNYTDKMSMSQGIEVRVPYLDKDLVEFSTRLPVEYKLHGTTTKYILRKLAEKYLPHDVIYRPKTGFGAPLRTWIKKDLDHWTRSQLSKEIVDRVGVFDYHEIQKLIEDNRSDKLDGAYTLLALIAIHNYIIRTSID